LESLKTNNYKIKYNYYQGVVFSRNKEKKSLRFSPLERSSTGSPRPSTSAGRGRGQSRGRGQGRGRGRGKDVVGREFAELAQSIEAIKQDPHLLVTVFSSSSFADRRRFRRPRPREMVRPSRWDPEYQKLYIYIYECIFFNFVAPFFFVFVPIMCEAF
jgi:hypothetical protein